MNAIHLNFINQSNASYVPQVVVFQKNEASDQDALAVAWRVIKNVSAGDNFPFTFSAENTISASDSWGNYTPRHNAANGQQFSLVSTPAGDALQLSGPASSPGQIEMLNALNAGAIDANIYRDGLLVAVKTGIAPGQQGAFAFAPTLWIGVDSQITQGQLMNAGIISQLDSQISLIGIKSADIVLTGGGPGTEATPFIFTLQNIEYA